MKQLPAAGAGPTCRPVVTPTSQPSKQEARAVELGAARPVGCLSLAPDLLQEPGLRLQEGQWASEPMQG